MQKLTNEELLELFGHNYNGSCEQYEAELLRLLNERDELEKQLAEARKAVEDLKCCGNCAFYTGWGQCGRNSFLENNIQSNKYCSIWQSDNLTREEREK